MQLIRHCTVISCQNEACLIDATGSAVCQSCASGPGRSLKSTAITAPGRSLSLSWLIDESTCIGHIPDRPGQDYFNTGRIRSIAGLFLLLTKSDINLQPVVGGWGFNIAAPPGSTEYWTVDCSRLYTTFEVADASIHRCISVIKMAAAQVLEDYRDELNELEPAI